MLSSLLVAAAVIAPGAPIPRDAVPNPTGPAPRVVAVKADSNGTVWITAYIYEKRKVPQQFFAMENGKQVLKQREVEQMMSNYVRKSLGEFGGKFGMANGRTITAEEALKRVKDGATMLIAADGKSVDKGWLMAVSGDTVVMMAEGLAHAHFQYNQYPGQNGAGVVMPTTATPRLVMLQTDDAGAVKIAVNSNPNNATNGVVYYDDFGGGRVGKRIMVQNDVIWDGNGYAPLNTGSPLNGTKTLADVKFDAYDATGRMVGRKEALARLKAGGLALLSSDNKIPDDGYLQGFREDVLVLVSGEFVFPQGQPNPYDMPVKPSEQPGGKPSPPINAPVQVLPAIGIAKPAIIRLAAPAVEPAVEKPVPKAEEKPAPEVKPAALPVKPEVKRD